MLHNTTQFANDFSTGNTAETKSFCSITGVFVRRFPNAMNISFWEYKIMKCTALPVEGSLIYS